MSGTQDPFLLTEREPEPEPIVIVEGLTRTYSSGGGDVHALAGVTFSLPVGALIALVGRSGSGKTTLLNCLGGLDTPTSGRVVVDGTDVAALDDRGRTALRRDRLAYVFQTFGLVPMLSAAENVGLPLRMRGVDSQQREERVTELLDLVGLTDHARQRPAELSGGQQQRVAIARALANAPRVLIADEPTGQLDAETGESIMALLESLVRDQGMTAIVATHDLRIRERADLVLVLADGKLQEGAGRARASGRHRG
ncbi:MULTISPECIES: ABC transporter ATP-binding protein [unclassified Leifsonia]|uniref:ABC transporter ATP-binding protein n=1 Tax=unclassified Leifsonia TaxID=2663824 RepID=UPI0006F8DE18|nr:MULTISPECIES: ABC transporter ATP-binding protein [unclassified Leifsonia]KQX08183.1 ABC transporter [Leifsonia sp. Root1293]KRA12465.1 ABC transporter [Leifsonia sp. Root60]